MSGEGFWAREGLATLGPELVEARRLLERRILDWAAGCGAEEMAFPSLIRVADLTKLDYFDNFPHLALMTAALNLPEDGMAGGGMAGGAIDDGRVPGERLSASEYALASAACYRVYLHLGGSTLAGPRRVTTVAQCARNEQRYEGLRRLRSFTMREIVCVGPREAVLDHITAFKPKIRDFARALGLAPDIAVASDPFFQADGARAMMQQLFPVKEEFVHDGSLAIASVNFHRNFFGERCRIGLPGGEPAYSGCVAFGLERWLAALLDRHGDAKTVLGVVGGAGRE